MNAKYVYALIIIALVLVSCSFAAINISQDKTNAEYNQAINNLSQQLNDTKLQLNNTEEQLSNYTSLLSVQSYDYLIYKSPDNSIYYAKNGHNGTIDFSSNDTAAVLNYAIENGNNIYVQSGTYLLYSNVVITDKQNVQLVSSGDATLLCNGHQIIVEGSSTQTSKYDEISGFIIYNGQVTVLNSFMTTVSDMIFDYCNVAIQLAINNTWTECSQIDNVQFYWCNQGIVFTGSNGTGSFENTMITRCYFNLADNSIAINVGPGVGFTDGQMENVHIWAGSFSGQQFNQTGLEVSGSLYRTVMDGVVFESFAAGDLTNSDIYAVDINTTFQTPILQEGVTFLGNWTSMVYNPYNAPIEGEGIGVAFKEENISIPVNPFVYPSQPVDILIAPSTITSFNVEITVNGSFSQNENITVRFQVQCLDDNASTGSEAVEKTFNASSTVWLSNADLLNLMPTQNVIQAIVVDAKSDVASTDAAVQVSIFGDSSWSEIL